MFHHRHVLGILPQNCQGQGFSTLDRGLIFPASSSDLNLFGLCLHQLLRPHPLQPSAIQTFGSIVLGRWDSLSMSIHQDFVYSIFQGIDLKEHADLRKRMQRIGHRFIHSMLSFTRSAVVCRKDLSKMMSRLLMRSIAS